MPTKTAYKNQDKKRESFFYFESSSRSGDKFILNADAGLSFYPTQDGVFVVVQARRVKVLRRNTPSSTTAIMNSTHHAQDKPPPISGDTVCLPVSIVA
jgi:hypothetical protein